jgi:hypothetical protein
VVLGLAVALVFASLSPLASPLPDALEAAALAGGFAGRATAGPSLGLVDYTWPGIASPALATLLAVAVGTLLVYALGTLLAGWLGRRR